MYHSNLGVIPLENAVAELTESKAYLEGLIEQPVDSIAFPDGSCRIKVVEKHMRLGTTISYLSSMGKSRMKVIQESWIGWACMLLNRWSSNMKRS